MYLAKDLKELLELLTYQEKCYEFLEQELCLKD